MGKHSTTILLVFLAFFLLAISASAMATMQANTDLPAAKAKKVPKLVIMQALAKQRLMKALDAYEKEVIMMASEMKNIDDSSTTKEAEAVLMTVVACKARGEICSAYDAGSCCSGLGCFSSGFGGIGVCVPK